VLDSSTIIDENKDWLGGYSVIDGLYPGRKDDAGVSTKVGSRKGIRDDEEELR